MHDYKMYGVRMFKEQHITVYTFLEQSPLLELYKELEYATYNF